MIVNDVNLVSEYGVIIVSRDIQNADVINYVDWLESSNLPNRIKGEKFTFASCKTFLLVEGNTETEVLDKISNILNLCKNGYVKFTDLDWYFNFQLSDTSNKKIYSNAYQLTLTMQVNYKYKPDIAKTFAGSSYTIVNNGNRIAPCKVEITPLISLGQITVSGFTDTAVIIKNLVKGKTIVFNDGTVTQDGQNKFNDVFMWEFPRLLPGNNSIAFDKDTVTIKVTYKEMMT